MARLGSRWCRRAVAAKCVVPLKDVRPHVVHVDVVAGKDVLGGKADDLAIFIDGLAPANESQGKLVAQANAAAQSHGGPVNLTVSAGGEIAGSHGDVVARAKVDGHLGEGYC
jgi:hypothetical protein